MTLPTALLVVTLLVVPSLGRWPQQRCFDAQVVKDQRYDDSYVCDLAAKNLTYPRDLINEDYMNLLDENMAFFIDTAIGCMSESPFFSNNHQTADYSYECLCPTRRQLIEAIFLNKQELCFVVEPQRQNVHYAKCGGRCNRIGYGVGVNSEDRDYLCVNSGYVQREFVVWCPNGLLGQEQQQQQQVQHPYPGEVQKGGSLARRARSAPQQQVIIQHHQPNIQTQPAPPVPYGTFRRVVYSMPTLCTCRGYFCTAPY